MMVRDGTETPPPTVTAEFTFKMLRPTPMEATLHLRARVVELQGTRAIVEATPRGGGAICSATFRGHLHRREGGPPGIRKVALGTFRRRFRMDLVGLWTPGRDPRGRKRLELRPGR